MSLASLLKKRCKKTLFTTPSHDGNFCIMHKFYQWYRSDISEVDALNPEEALEKSEQNAAKIYGVKSTHFLTNGSTTGIIAATLACCKKNDKILIWEKAHPCHKNAAILSGADIIEYSMTYNEEWGIYEPLNATEFEELIKKHSPKAVIVTSPTYEGLVSDVKTFSNICKRHKVYFIVDEAHGALYPFSDRLPESSVKHADFTVQSLHKTAGGINPTALIHCNCECDIKNALKLINTTSPSYPMLATIEANIRFLASKRGKKALENLIDKLLNLKSSLTNIDFYGDDITKLLIKKSGFTGFELSQILFEKYNIEDEKTNEKSTMLLTGIGTSDAKIRKLHKLKKM